MKILIEVFQNEAKSSVQISSNLNKMLFCFVKSQMNENWLHHWLLGLR